MNAPKGPGSDGINHKYTQTHKVSPRITRYSKARLTSDLRGQGRRTLGDKWSASSIVRTVALSIYWLPKWSIMKWFTSSTRHLQSWWVGVCSIQRTSAQIDTAFDLSEPTEAGLHRVECLFKANRRVRKLLCMSLVGSGTKLSSEQGKQATIARPKIKKDQARKCIHF